MSYEFSGNTASQTTANPDGTSVVSTWTFNRGSGLTQTDQLRLANGDVAATSVTDSKATQTLSLSEAGAKAGLIIAQQRKTGDGWTNTGLAVINHEITSDGSLQAAAHLRDLAAEIAAIPDIGPQPLRVDTPVPDVFANTDRADLRELNFDSYVAAGALGQQADGSIGVLALSVRGASGAAAGERPGHRPAFARGGGHGLSSLSAGSVCNIFVL